MEPLLTDPRFENLLAKIEAHQWEFLPRKSEILEAAGELRAELEARAKECWELLKACRVAAMTLVEA